MKYILSLLLCASFAQARPIKVAIIDSGLDGRYQKTLPLCPDGHRSFNSRSWDEDGRDGHGTNVAMIVHKHIGTLPNYCFIIIKILDSKDFFQQDYLAEAIDYARLQNVSAINISISGQGADKAEKIAIQKALDKNIVVLVSAGNNSLDIDMDCIVYPACYKFTKNKKGFEVVGNYMAPGVKHPSSNYGSVITKWEIGTAINTFEYTMTGTSQATAVATGKLVRKFLTKEKKQKGDYEN